MRRPQKFLTAMAMAVTALMLFSTGALAKGSSSRHVSAGQRAGASAMSAGTDGAGGNSDVSAKTNPHPPKGSSPTSATSATTAPPPSKPTVGSVPTGDDPRANPKATDPKATDPNTTDPKSASTSCSGGLTGLISGNSATVTNGTAEAHLVGLASYKMFDGGIADQELVGHQEVTVAACSSATLTVSLPSCAYQIDLFHDVATITTFGASNRYSDSKLDSKQVFGGEGRSFCAAAAPASTDTTDNDTTAAGDTDHDVFKLDNDNDTDNGAVETDNDTTAAGDTDHDVFKLDNDTDTDNGAVETDNDLTAAGDTDHDVFAAGATTTTTTPTTPTTPTQPANATTQSTQPFGAVQSETATAAGSAQGAVSAAEGATLAMTGAPLSLLFAGLVLLALGGLFLLRRSRQRDL